MTIEAEPAGDDERSAALDGWAAAFDDEMEQSGDFAKSVAAMRTHGCFDVRAAVERWILANPTGGTAVAPVQPELQEPAALRLVPDEPRAPQAAAEPVEPALSIQPTPRLGEAVSSPDIAYFRSLLQGGIERAQIDEAFPAFRVEIDEAVGQHEAAEGPILSEVPPAPTREDLNDEIRGMRQRLQASTKRGRRRWRARD